jgi:CRISPR-associated endonuclease Csy4
MDYYIELTLIKDSEISPYFIWSKLYTQLHLAFVELKDANEQIPYGVSFPEYKTIENKGKRVMLLGSKLRVFANSADELQKLDLDKWLARLTDYVHVKSPKQVENVTQYLTVNRYRPKPNIEHVARRYARRKEVTFEQAITHLTQVENDLNGYAPKHEPYPYIQLKSLSGDREFSLCLNQHVVEKPAVGKFSTYGLSATSTVPHW